MLGVSADDKHLRVTVEKDRAGVHRRRPQGQSSQASVSSGMAAGIPHSRTLASGRRSGHGSGPSDLFAPNVTQMCTIYSHNEPIQTV